MLEGRYVNLRVAEKKDVSLIVEWWNDVEYMGKYQDIVLMSENEAERVMLRDTIFFIVEKKDGVRIGHINGWWRLGMMEIGFGIVPTERDMGYGREAIQLMVDHLFLSKSIAGIQALMEVGNKVPQRALERVGFAREGPIQKSLLARGELRAMYIYSIFREEWKDQTSLHGQLRSGLSCEDGV